MASHKTSSSYLVVSELVFSMAKMIHFMMSGWFLAVNVVMTNSCANTMNSNVKVTKSIAKGKKSIAKLMNPIANGTNSTVKATNSIANGRKSIAKVMNSIAKTCTSGIISNKLSTFKSNKSPGPDGLHPLVLRRLQHNYICNTPLSKLLLE